MQKKNFSRRNILRAGGAGIAAASASALANPSSNEPSIQWHEEFDVVVCGSGAAGCMAALSARKAGASVLLIEKNSVWGGTSGKSGFHIWIPNNSHMRKEGLTDPKDQCLHYMAEQSYPHLFNPEDSTLGLSPRIYALLNAFYDQASSTVDLLSEWNVLEFSIAKLGMLQVTAVDYNENSKLNGAITGRSLMPLKKDGSMAMGRYSVRAFKHALEEAGVDIRTRHSAARLYRNSDGAVEGLQVTSSEGKTINVRSGGGVVFATGCYTANKDYLNQFQMMPTMGGCGAPSNTGDFIAIGGEAGAQMGNLSGAWRSQIILEDNINYVSTPAAVFWPVGDSMFIANKYGQRCVNEKRNYNDRTKALYNYDANLCEFPNLINFMIYDQRCAELYAGSYPIPVAPTAGDHVVSGETLEQLAANLEKRLKSAAAHTGNLQLADGFLSNLKQSMQRFNAMAERGVDEDFQRGQFEYDKAWHDMQRRPPDPRWPEPVNDANRTMHPLQSKGPYYAIILLPGCLGTNGGPVINESAQVLDYRNAVIPGLYGAGNCIASPAANAYWGGGTTIGTALTFGRIAGEHAARQPKRSAV